MKRREFITLLCSAAAAWPRTGHAQAPVKIARLGFLGATFAASWDRRMEAFQSSLRDLGYVQGKNIFIESRWAEERYGQLPALAEELVRLRVDILLTYGTPGTLAAKQATTEIPIVFFYIGDAVSTGVVSSLARPGANVTGNTYFLPELMAKRLELLKDTMPNLSRAAVLVKPENPLFETTLPAVQAAANSLKIELQQFDARDRNELEPAFLAMTKNNVEAVVLQEDAVFLANLSHIVELAERQSLPIAGPVEFSEVGGLIGYGADFLDMCRHTAVFVDKILRGAKTADLPVERATRFETVLNVETAKKLGLSIPPLVILRADRVFE